MSNGIRRSTWWSGWPLIMAISSLAIAAEKRSHDPIAEGEGLFIKEFSVGKAGPNGGDGLGPLFNHVSCAACHRQGALGGGGGIEFNVSLLTAQLEPGKRRPDQKMLIFTLRNLHPAFVDE